MIALYKPLLLLLQKPINLNKFTLVLGKSPFGWASRSRIWPSQILAAGTVLGFFITLIYLLISPEIARLILDPCDYLLFDYSESFILCMLPLPFRYRPIRCPLPSFSKILDTINSPSTYRTSYRYRSFTVPSSTVTVRSSTVTVSLSTVFLSLVTFHISMFLYISTIDKGR